MNRIGMYDVKPPKFIKRDDEEYMNQPAVESTGWLSEIQPITWDHGIYAQSKKLEQTK